VRLQTSTREVRAFVSYARADGNAAHQLAHDLSRMVHQCWLDTERLHGGQRWWEEILRQIAQSTFVVIAIGPGFLTSEWCRRELEWATACQRPLLPVRIGSLAVEQVLTGQLTEHQVVHYRPRTADAAVTLANAVIELSRRPTDPPSPLPTRPEVPEAIEDDVERVVRLVAVTVEWATPEELAEWNIPSEQRRWAVRLFNESSMPMFEVTVHLASNNHGSDLDLLLGTVPPNDRRGVPYILNDEIADFDPYGDPPTWRLSFRVSGVHYEVGIDGLVLRSSS
jgi:hypothetical protein